MKSYANKLVYINGELQNDLESKREYDGKKLRIMDRNFNDVVFQELDNKDLKRLLTRPVKHKISLKKTIKTLMRKKRKVKQTRRKKDRTRKRKKKKKKKKKKTKNWLQKTTKRIKKLF